jgi:transglutaminase-like putative cysteine protease
MTIVTRQQLARNRSSDWTAMRLRISHSTTYRYAPAATGVIQILRMTPGSHDGQYVADWQIDVSTDARLDMHEDAFGNVTHVITHGAIEELTITAEGLIETHDTGGVLKGADERFPPGLFLRGTPLTTANPAMTSFVRELRAESDDSDVLGFLHTLMTQINEHMTFDEDPTNSGTSAAEAFVLRRGVCQDYAHIFIACARAGGVPARFVSGHFLRSDGAAQQQAGHAWAEAFVPGLGWIGFDAANCICSTDTHARIAIGLDYLGAAPVRGTRYGGGLETLDVRVRVEQVGRPGQSQTQSQSQS